MIKKVNVLGIEINNIDKHEVLSIIDNWLINKDQARLIFTPNVDFLVKSQNDAEFKNILQNADLLIPDGKPLIWASKFFRNPLKEKVAGSSLFFDICHLASRNDHSIFILGAEEGVAKVACEKLKLTYENLRIVGYYSPPHGFENNESETRKIINLIKSAKPDILFVGLGAPKQEKWLYRYKNIINVPVSLGIGASIDFAAGIKSIPPNWIKDLGFAWLWRLLNEPRRLWKRYLLEDPKFFLYIFMQKYHLREF